MEGMIILAICVIIWLTYIVCKSIRGDCKVITSTDTVTVIVETPAPVVEPVVDDKPKFSPPVYELEQWIKDNWKKISIITIREQNYKVTCSLFNINVFADKYNSVYSYKLYSDSGAKIRTGLNQTEINYLVNVYLSIVDDRARKLERILVAKQRKQLARKLQQLGYGSGEYESK